MNLELEKLNDNGLLTLRSAKSLSSATLTSPIFIVSLEPAQQRSRSKKIRSKNQRNKGTRSYPSWRVTLAIAFNYQSICLREAVTFFWLRITPKSVTPAPLGTIRTQNVTFRQAIIFFRPKKGFFYWKFRTRPKICFDCFLHAHIWHLCPANFEFTSVAIETHLILLLFPSSMFLCLSRCCVLLSVSLCVFSSQLVLCGRQQQKQRPPVCASLS